jgi:hypothetical protein
MGTRDGRNTRTDERIRTVSGALYGIFQEWDLSINLFCMELWPDLL